MHLRNLFQTASPVEAPPLRSSHKPVAAQLRRSNGLREFLLDWKKSEGRTVLDLGCTSSANVAFFTNLGHGFYNDDLLRDAANPRYQATTDSGPQLDPARLLEENLVFPAGRFDGALLWDLMDYIPEPLVKPLVERLTRVLQPGGTILAYFHTKDAGPEADYFRYHIHDPETLQLRPGEPHRLQRIFNNRHIENLFQGYRSIKFFLARDNLREVLATK